MMKRMYVVTACLLLAAGCSPSVETLATQTSVAATATAAAWALTQTATPTSTATPIWTPTITPTPTPTSTPTPTPLPRVSVSVDSVKLRNGPGADYVVLETASRGDSLQLRARNQDGSWLQVLSAKGNTVWVPADSVQVAKETIDALAAVSEFPQTPPPIFNWKGDPVETVCVVIEQKLVGKFANEHPDEQPDSIDSLVRDTLSGLGIEMAAPGAACQASLTIKTTIEMVGENYYEVATGRPVGFCYSGAEVLGTFTLSSPDAAVSYSEGQRQNPLERMYSCPTRYGYADFSQTVIQTGLKDIWRGAAAAPIWSDKILVFPSKKMSLYGDAGGSQVIASIEPNSYFYCWGLGQEGQRWKVVLYVTGVGDPLQPNDYLMSGEPNQKINGKSPIFGQARAVIPLQRGHEVWGIQGYLDTDCGQ